MQSAQQDLDNKIIQNIFLLNKYLGYKVNPYKMSSSQLNDCYEEMQREFQSRYGYI